MQDNGFSPDWWARIIADDDRAIAEARAIRDGRALHSRDWGRANREVLYLEKRRAQHVLESERREREAAAERAAEELKIAKLEAREASQHARQLSKLLPTGKEIREAARYRTTFSRSRSRAHAARRRRLDTLWRRVDRAEALGAPTRRVAWARACLRLCLDTRPGRAELGEVPQFPYLMCLQCGGLNCEHPLI